MPGTISHVLSMTSPNDPAYENQPKHWNSSHLATFNLSGSEISNAFGNGGGVSFGLSADGNITASAPAAAPSPINFSAGTTSNNLGSVVFSNSNGLAFGLSGSTITGSYTQSTHTHRTEFQALTLGGNTAGTTTFAASNNDTIFLNGGNNITLSGNGSTVTISGPTLTNSSWTVSDTATSVTVGRLAFTNANGVTMTLSTSNNGNHTVFASHNGITSQSTQFIAMTLAGNTAGTTTFHATNNASLFFNGGANITLSGNGSTVTISGAAQSNQSAIKAFGASNTGNTAGNTGVSTGIDWVIAGTNSITVSESTAAGGPNTLWISGPTQSNQTLGLYALGNTTQNSSSTFDARTVSFNALGAMTWGYSNGSVQVSAPATSSLVGTSGISISTAGSTISVYPKPLSAYDPFPIVTGSAVSSHAPASFWFSKMNLDWPIVVSYVNVFKSLNVSAPGASSQNSSLTNKFSYSHGFSIFTRQDFAGNSTNMSQWTTASFGMTGTLSQSSSSASIALSWVTNSTGGTTSFSTTSGSNLWTNFFTGMQIFRIPLVTTMTPGEYFIGQAQSSTTATVGSNFTLLSVSNLHVAPQSVTLATITSSGSLVASSPDGLGIGVASAVTTNNTMAISVVSAGTQNWWYANFSNV